MEVLVSVVAGAIGPWAAAINGLTELPVWVRFAVLTVAMFAQIWIAFHNSKKKDKTDGK
jgi:hypothetical protein